MRVPPLLRIAIGLIATGALIYAAGRHWAPTTVAVERRISLAKGQIDLPEFEVNNEHEYHVWIGFDNVALGDLPNCKVDAIKGFHAHWLLSRDAHTIAQGDLTVNNIGSFVSEPGTYRLSITVPVDGSCMDGAVPWLIVRCNDNPDPLETRWWAGAFIILGLGLLLPVRTLTKPVKLPPEVVPPSGSLPAPLSKRREWPLQKRISWLPNFGLAGAIVIGFAVVGIMFTLALVHDMWPPRGIRVSVSAKRYAEAMADKQVGPLIVRVEWFNKSVRYRVNGTEVPRENLGAALKQELSRRADWTIFVEGDDDLPYDSIVYAIDQANKLHAKPVMLTPGMKREVR